MVRQKAKSAAAALLLVGALNMAGCHADDNDPKGQAEELADPVRREHAMERLRAIFNQRLVEAKGDRAAPSIKEFTDQTIDNLVRTYQDHPEDSVNRLRILQLLEELRDPRALPALIDALQWQQEVSEEGAVTAARTLTKIDIPADKKGEVIAGISKALERVQGSRGIDNRMRKAFIEALGTLKDKRAADTLVKVMLSQDQSQNFLFNILAGQQLIAIAEEEHVPALIKALYVSDPENPAMRMNDVAASALVAVGRPALQPLIETLRGNNQDANEMVKQFIASIRQKNPEAAADLKVGTLVASEAGYTLGKLGFREAVKPLIDETKDDDLDRAFSGALALVSINREPNDEGPIVEAMVDVYKRSPKQQRPQLLVAMRHLYADKVMPFLLDVAQTSDPELPAVQVYGYVSYANLANKSEAQALKRIFDREVRLRPHLKDFQAAIAAADECDKDVKCWTGKLQDKDTVVVRKALNMLARYARGNEEAINKAVELFGHDDLEVRNEAVYAVDSMATKGSKAAVEKIDKLQAEEEGRSIWSNFQREALPARARLEARENS